MVTPDKTAYIGLGANLGSAKQAVRQALTDLNRLPHTRLVTHSSLYRTQPIEAGGPNYINAVAKIATRLPPMDLLTALLNQEYAAGRQRSFQNAPRTLDLDLLLYDKLQVESDVLTLPHPRMHQRAFVLAPLAEIAPGLCHPVYGSIDELLASVASQAIERLES